MTSSFTTDHIVTDMTDTNNSIFILDMFSILSNSNMITELQEKPRTTRVQRSPNSGQWSVGIPVDVAQSAQLERGDTVKFTVQDRGRILLEVLS
jgi:uncharacterized membrane protein (UPF0127 family)